MRPDLSDLLSGVQRLLQGEIVPALSDPFAQEQATFAFLLLEYVKKAWPREHLVVREEHEDLCATLAEITTRAAELPSAEARALADALGALTAASDVPASEVPLDSLLAADRERRAALEKAVELVDRLEQGTGSGPSIEALRASIDGYLARQAARHEAALRVLGVGW